MKKKPWIALAFLVVALLGLSLLRPGSDKAPSVSSAGNTGTVVAAEGKVEAMPGYDVNLASGELNGKVGKILVREGDAVTAGQLVAVLENEDAQARVKAAERELAVAESRLREILAGARREEIEAAAAALAGALAARDEAKRQYQRYQGLLARGMVAPAAVDERERLLKTAEAAAAEAEQRKKLLDAGPRAETVRLYRDQVAQAKAALDYSRSLLEKTELRAPIAGRVIKRYLDEGEGVTPEIPVLAIADLEKVWINAEVDETDVGSVHLGDTAEITSDAYRGKLFSGKVVQIADYAGARSVTPANPAVNLGLKVVQVKIAPDQPTPFRLGMTVDVKIRPAGH